MLNRKSVQLFIRSLRRRSLALALVFALLFFLLGNDHYNAYAIVRKNRAVLPGGETAGNPAGSFRQRSWLISNFLAGGDNCVNATNVTVSPFNDSGNTTGSNNTISNYNSVNLVSPYPGPDQFYRINLVANGSIGATMSLTGSTLDGAIFLMNVCPAGLANTIPAANSLGNSQDAIGGGAGPEILPVTTVPAGVYYISVDSYYGSGVSSAGPYSITINATGLTLPTAAGVSVAGRVTAPNGSGIARVRVTATRANGEIVTATTNSFGYYRFNDLPSGETYVFSVSSKRNRFANPTRVISLTDNIADLDFSGTD